MTFILILEWTSNLKLAVPASAAQWRITLVAALADCAGPPPLRALEEPAWAVSAANGPSPLGCASSAVQSFLTPNEFFRAVRRRRGSQPELCVAQSSDEMDVLIQGLMIGGVSDRQ